MIRGGRNLMIFGFTAILIAIITTVISVAIYVYSGDIYLDRSRPGFLPDVAEQTEDKSGTSYEFPKSGPVTASALSEYLDNLDAIITELNKLEDPFSDTPLLNSSLDIPEE